MEFVRGAQTPSSTKAPPGSLAKDWTSCSCLFGDPRGVLVKGAVVRLKTQDAFSGEYGDIEKYDDVQRKWLVRLHRREVAIAPMSFSYVELHFAYRVMLGDASEAVTRTRQKHATGDAVFVEWGKYGQYEFVLDVAKREMNGHLRGNEKSWRRLEYTEPMAAYQKKHHCGHDH